MEGQACCSQSWPVYPPDTIWKFTELYGNTVFGGVGGASFTRESSTDEGDCSSKVRVSSEDSLESEDTWS